MTNQTQATVEEVAREIWFSEYLRATGKDRNTPWDEAVSDEDKDRYRFIARRILALPSVGWRTDMENAPRDGTRFQGGMFDPVDGSFRQFVCFWNPGWKGVEGVSDAGPFWQGGGMLEHPTHWRELLPPPPQPVEDQ